MNEALLLSKADNFLERAIKYNPNDQWWTSRVFYPVKTDCTLPEDLNLQPQEHGASSLPLSYSTQCPGGQG